MKINQVVEAFLTEAIESGGWMILDRIYLRNRVYTLLDIPQETDIDLTVEEEDYLAALMSFQASRGLRSDQLADLVTPPPSVVNALFAQRYEKDPYDATAYFYELNQKNKRLADVQMPQAVQSTYEEVAYYNQAQGDMVAEACTYCMENEGFASASEETSQLTKRMIRMNLQGQTWNYHFATAPKWHEECVFTSEHHDYQGDLTTKLTQLQTLNNLFPHYFVASLGGFVGHPAYLGGATKLPVMLANVVTTTESLLFKGITVSEVNWPVSSVRMFGQDSQQLSKAVEFLLMTTANKGITEPMVIFSDCDNQKQVYIIFVETLDSPNLALGVLVAGETVEMFTQLVSKDSLASQVVDLKMLLTAL